MEPSKQVKFTTEVKFNDLKDLNKDQKSSLIIGIKRYISTGVKTFPAEKQQQFCY